jgi:hypothetical protein
MEDNKQPPLTLSREDLYELAWSKPMSELAKDFAISDVALAKRCKKLGIPVPGRGYWARLDAGQTPYRPKLPKRAPEWNDQNALTIAPTAEPDSREPQGQEFDTVRARIEGLSTAPSASILVALPAVRRTALRLKHPRRSEVTFNRGDRSGPIVLIDVTGDALDRALLFADALLRATDSLGWSFVAPVPSSSAEERVGRNHSASTEKPKREPPRSIRISEGNRLIAAQTDGRDSPARRRPLGHPKGTSRRRSELHRASLRWKRSGVLVWQAEVQRENPGYTNAPRIVSASLSETPLARTVLYQVAAT